MKYFVSKDGQTSTNATGWAIGIALGVHIVALCILTALSFARPAEDILADVPQATISQIKSISETPAIAPKPKIVEPPLLAQSKSSPKSWTSPTQPQEYHRDGGSETGLTALAATTNSTTSRLALPQTRPEGRIEFFGSYSYDREIFFVVDCSGSMKGLFGQVLRQLKQTLDSLEPDQHFYIIFFGGNTLHEYGGDKLVRATPEAKDAAYKFAKALKPSGKTDALSALRRAMEIKNARGDNPAVIYFLTDGFELDGAASKNFCKNISSLRQKLSPNVKINTIGFWTQENDKPVLETIAKTSGGQCVLVSSER